MKERAEQQKASEREWRNNLTPGYKLASTADVDLANHHNFGLKQEQKSHHDTSQGMNNKRGINICDSYTQKVIFH